MLDFIQEIHRSLELVHRRIVEVFPDHYGKSIFTDFLLFPLRGHRWGLSADAWIGEDEVVHGGAEGCRCV